MRIARWLASAALAASVLAATTQAGEPDATNVDGAAAPPDAWLMDGGCAARTGLSSARPLAGPVETAWEQQFKGSIEGEPLVQGAWVFVCVVESAARPNSSETPRRTLYVLDLAKGAVAAKKTFKTPLPLVPCLGSGLVVLRTGFGIEAFRWKAPELWPVWKLDVYPFSFVLFGREAYVLRGDSVARYEVGRRVPTWEVQSKFRGRLALRGGGVYVVDYDERGNASLAVLSRVDGSRLTSAATGHHAGGPPGRGEDTRILAGDRRVFVHHAKPIVTSDGAGANTSDFDVIRGQAMEARLRECRGDAAEWGLGWLAQTQHEEGLRLFLATQADGVGYVLADAATHSEFTAQPLAPSLVRGVAYVAGCAVDLDTFQVLWRSGRRPVGRMVPARDTALVVEADGKLVALREARPQRQSTRIATSAPPTLQGRAALSDGSTVAGTFALDPRAGTLVLDGKPPRSIAPADVLVLEDAAGAIVAAGVALDDVARGLDAFLAREISDGWAALAKSVASCRDEGLLRHVVEEAWAHGVAPTDVAEAEARLRDFAKPTMTSKIDAVLSTKVAERERALAGRPAAFAWEHAKSLPAGSPPSVLVDLLRVTLSRDPSHADAIARLKSLLPPDIVPDGPFQSGDWLDFAEAVAQSPVEILPPPRSDDPKLTHVQRTYGSLLHSWRPDLVALRSRQLLLVSPVARPGALARCLSMGELLCSSLDGIFAKGSRRRTDPEPLTLLLFESAAEYDKALTRRDPGHDLGWSWGCYSPAEELSRMYLPEDDDGFRRVMNVFAHELTHQWIEQRCPLFTSYEARTAPADRPGYWIVEGFAKLVEEMSWDLRRRAWARNPRSASPGIVAAAPPEWLLAWPRLLSMSSPDFHRLDHKPRFEVPSSARLGTRVNLSESHFFYAQSATLCQYLFFAEDGKHRDKLLAFLGAYYRGDKATTESSFGLDPAELGRRATEFARAAHSK